MSMNDLAGESSGRAAQSRNLRSADSGGFTRLFPFAKTQSLSSGYLAWPIGNGPRNPKRRSERIRSILRNLRILVSGSTIHIISIYKQIGQKARPTPFTKAESKQKKKKMVLK
jgi:hypothetical protein